MSPQTVPPPTLALWEEAPTARRTDPETSHAAADKARTRLTDTKRAILDLARFNPPMTDTELDDLYAQNWERKGWPKQRYDSPRKRRSELLKDGYLRLTGESRYNRFGALEQEWTANDE